MTRKKDTLAYPLMMTSGALLLNEYTDIYGVLIYISITQILWHLFVNHYIKFK